MTILFYLILAALVAGVLFLARVIPNDSSTTMREESADVMRATAEFGRWLWNAGRRAKRKPRALWRRRGGRHVAAADHGDITEAEHEQAVAYVLGKYGRIPPSLARVIAVGGRIGLPERKQEVTN